MVFVSIIMCFLWYSPTWQLSAMCWHRSIIKLSDGRERLIVEPRRHNFPWTLWRIVAVQTSDFCRCVRSRASSRIFSGGAGIRVPFRTSGAVHCRQTRFLVAERSTWSRTGCDVGPSCEGTVTFLTLILSNIKSNGCFYWKTLKMGFSVKLNRSILQPTVRFRQNKICLVM